MEKQVDKPAYDFARYTGLDRWSSYYYQLREAFAAKPASILEIGGGDGTFAERVRAAGIAYTSVDVAEDLHPDVVASVTSLPFPDDSFDVVCAFEVLEHLPFDQFDRAVGELARVSRGRVLLSLPHYGPSVRFELKVPGIRMMRFAAKLPHHPRHAFNGQHYWEMGKKGYSAQRIRAALAKRFIVRKEFIPFENQYHHFFVLDTRV